MYLTTCSFEDGMGDWKPVNLPQAVAWDVIDDPANAKQGRKFMRVSTTQVGGSVAHDVRIAGTLVWELYRETPASPVTRAVIDVVRSLQFSVWLRSANRQRTVQGSVAIWDLVAVGDLVAAKKDPVAAARLMPFNVGGQWTQVSVGYDRITPKTYGPANTGPAPANVRVEIYLDTLNRGLDVDAAVLI
jgi:hypothetical protein